MPANLNNRAKAFAFRHLFLAEADEGYVAASLSLRDLAFEFCVYDECPDGDGVSACRRHRRAMVLGASKLIAAGDLFTEMSGGGVIYVRLSPRGVLSPFAWPSQPDWFFTRADLITWAVA